MGDGVRTGDVLVLAFHSVSDEWRSELAVTRDGLRGHVESLLARGYRAQTFTEAVLEPRSRRTFAITFDDAYASLMENALPVLDELGVPATVFVPTDFVGLRLAWPGIDHWLGTEHDRELLALDADELRELAARGWEIGAHTCSHVRLDHADDETLHRELRDSRLAVEELTGRPCTSVAYPYGFADDRVAAAAHACGYRAACILDSRRCDPDPLLFPRVGMEGLAPGALAALKLHPAVRRMRASRGWAAVRALRTLQRTLNGAPAPSPPDEAPQLGEPDLSGQQQHGSESQYGAAAS